EIANEAFNKCREANLIDKPYSFDKYELDQKGIEITGDHYSCGDTDYESFHIPYADLDDIDAFVTRRQTEIAEEKREAMEKRAVEDEQKKAAGAVAERHLYEKLK